MTKLFTPLLVATALFATAAAQSHAATSAAVSPIAIPPQEVVVTAPLLHEATVRRMAAADDVQKGRDALLVAQLRHQLGKVSGDDVAKARARLDAFQAANTAAQAEEAALNARLAAASDPDAGKFELARADGLR